MFRRLVSQALFSIAELQSSRDISGKLKQMRAIQQKPFGLRKLENQRKLARLATAAGAHVPYYRDLFKQLSFDPTDLERDSAYLQELPFLTKEIIREQGLRMLSEKQNERALHIRRTGGSTGATLPVYYDQVALDWTSACNRFVEDEIGRHLHLRSALLLSESALQKSPEIVWQERLKSLATNRSFISVHDLSDSSAKDLYHCLSKGSFFLIEGHPSILTALASYLSSQGISGKGLFSIFESTGETLDGKKHERIENFFGCKVVNRLGSAEFGVYAFSRDNFGKLFVIDSMVLPETSALGNGLDELVLTSLTNEAMPLIRYKTGDVAKLNLLEDGYILENIQGRIHDIIECNHRTLSTQYIQDFFERSQLIDNFQIVISANKPLHFKLVPTPGASIEMILQLVKTEFGENVAIEITEMSGLTLQGWRSKFRYIVRTG